MPSLEPPAVPHSVALCSRDGRGADRYLLQGTWALAPRGVGGDPDSWLIVRKRDRSSEQPRGEGSREQPVPSEIRRGKRVVRLSNLDKPFWPERGITKGDLLRYYRDVAPALVPHLRDRPFTMKRYPDGWQGKPFFRKNAANYAPAWIKRVAVRVTSRGTPQQSRTIEAPVVNDELALLWMVNTGCIECHTWYSRSDRLERPDRVVFDLDP